MASGGLKFENLTQRIDIYNVVLTRDEIGGEVAAKTLWKQCWAKVEPQMQQQNYRQNVRQNERSLNIYMRFQIGLSNQMIITFNGHDYEIQSIVNVDAADGWVKILAATNGEI